MQPFFKYVKKERQLAVSIEQNISRASLSVLRKKKIEQKRSEN